MNNLVGIGIAIFALYLLGKGEKGSDGQVIVNGQSVPVEPQLTPKNVTPVRTPTPIRITPTTTPQITGGGGSGGGGYQQTYYPATHQSPCHLGVVQVATRDWRLAQVCEDGSYYLV